LTRQRDVLQSRSALTFIKELVVRIGTEDASPDGRLRRVSAAELVLRTRAEMLPEPIAAERETGGSIAETLQMLLQRLQGHLGQPQELALAGIAVLAKIRFGKISIPLSGSLPRNWSTPTSVMRRFGWRFSSGKMPAFGTSPRGR
jgi:hypothetical protein